MVRLCRVTIPWEEGDRIAKVLNSQGVVHGLERNEGLAIHPDNTLVKSCTYTFKAVEKKIGRILQVLAQYGVGNAYGSIDIMALSSTKPSVSTYRRKKEKKARRYEVADSLSIDEIRMLVEGQYHLTFDYLAFVASAAMIAGVGLLTNSSTSVVASMLVSPLMGPIVGMTFGTIAREFEMVKTSVRNEIIGIFLCFLVGSLMGFGIAPFYNAEDTPVTQHNTEMSSRGTWWGLLSGAFVAIPSGCGVGIGFTSDSVNPLVGCAISAALLPPIVNSGLSLTLGLMYHLQGEKLNLVLKYVSVGYISFILFFMNWLLIYIFALVIFRIKALHEHVEKSHQTQAVQQFHRMETGLGLSRPLLQDDKTEISMGEMLETQDTFRSQQGELVSPNMMAAPNDQRLLPSTPRLRMQSVPANTALYVKVEERSENGLDIV